MQASRSKGAMSRSSDRRQSAKGFFTFSLSDGLGLRHSVGPPRYQMNSATVTGFALQSAHDARVYHPALVSYSLRACGLVSPGIHSDTERGFILRLSPEFRQMGAQAN